MILHPLRLAFIVIGLAVVGVGGAQHDRPPGGGGLSACIEAAASSPSAVAACAQDHAPR
jgi:hypothetical protein